jgi:hypothetical protein
MTSNFSHSNSAEGYIETENFLSEYSTQYCARGSKTYELEFTRLAPFRKRQRNTKYLTWKFLSQILDIKNVS